MHSRRAWIRYWALKILHFSILYIQVTPFPYFLLFSSGIIYSCSTHQRFWRHGPGKIAAAAGCTGQLRLPDRVGLYPPLRPACPSRHESGTNILKVNTFIFISIWVCVCSYVWKEHNVFLYVIWERWYTKQRKINYNKETKCMIAFF